MIKSITVGGFKAFDQPVTIPTGKLTLVFGPNSSGKSSFIHSLLWASEVKNRNLDTQMPALGGGMVDLGGFTQFVHEHDASRRVTWGVSGRPDGLVPERVGDEPVWPYSTPVASLIDDAGFTFEVGIDVDGARNAVLKLLALRWSVNGTDFVTVDYRRGKASAALAPSAAPLIRELLSRDSNGSRWSALVTVSADDSSGVGFTEEVTDPSILAMVAAAYLEEQLSRAEFDGTDFRQCALGEVEVEGVRYTMGEDLESLVHLLFGAPADVFERALTSLNYIGPLRVMPDRLPEYRGDMPQGAAATGQAAWQQLLRSEDLRGSVNEWLSGGDALATGYRLRVRHYLRADDLSVDELMKAAEQIPVRHEMIRAHEMVMESTRLDRIRMFAAESRHMLQLVLEHANGLELSHRDVGVGISQVLPVLAAAYGSIGQLVVVEQPELHLHPALQARLADALLEASVGERANQLIVETHSEHLMLRVLRRVRETASGGLPDGCPPVLPCDVCVLYFELGEDGKAEVTHIPLTEDGDFARRWPRGFFPERAEELF